MQILGAVDDQVHRPAGFLVGQVVFHQFRAASGVDQMVEADPRDVHFFEQVEDGRDFIDVELVDGKAQADFYAGRLAVADAFQGVL